MDYPLRIDGCRGRVLGGSFDRIPRHQYYYEEAKEKSSMARPAIVSLASEFWAFLRVRKKWWLAPIIIIMALFGGLIVFTQGSALAPFVYTIF